MLNSQEEKGDISSEDEDDEDDDDVEEDRSWCGNVEILRNDVFSSWLSSIPPIDYLMTLKINKLMLYSDYFCRD
jgi:hypothetical protein